jgi:integrase
MPKAKRDRDGIFEKDPGSGWLWLQYRGRHSLRTKDRDTARQRARDLRRRLDDPANAAAHVTTIAQACEAFRDYAATGQNRARPPSPETFEMYEYHFAHWCRILGRDSPIASVNASGVDRYIAQRRREHVGPEPKHGMPDRRRTVKAGTVDKELGTMRQILRLGLRRGWYHLPLERVMPESAGGEYVPLTRALTLEEVPRLLAELEPGRAATCAYVVALGADWCAVERATALDCGTAEWCATAVLVRGTKNPRRWASVPVVPPFGEFVDLARAWLASVGRFPRWSGPNRCRDLAAACKRAGLPRITIRDLRRTHGQILSDRGVPPYLIAEMLRQADSRMAERVYGQRSREAVGRQVTAVSRGR